MKMTAAEYIQELIDERERLDPSASANSIRLLESEIEKVRQENLHGGEIYSPTGPELYEEEVVKLVEKIILPIEGYPGFNFVGKIIGPKGATLKGIVAQTRTKISVLGRGSTRNHEKEEELLQSGDPKHEHFKEPLHVLIQVEAHRSEAHERLSHAMEEINKAMSPDYIDTRAEQDFSVNIAAFAPNYGMHAPIIKVGIPPPGAIVLNDHTTTRNISRGTKGGGYREKSRY